MGFRARIRGAASNAAHDSEKERVQIKVGMAGSDHFVVDEFFFGTEVHSNIFRCG